MEYEMRTPEDLVRIYGLSDWMSLDVTRTDVAWFWSQVAQAALCELARAELAHAQWSDFKDDLHRAYYPNWVIE
jgi:hypothetical protein